MTQIPPVLLVSHDLSATHNVHSIKKNTISFVLKSCLDLFLHVIRLSYGLSFIPTQFAYLLLFRAINLPSNNFFCLYVPTLLHTCIYKKIYCLFGFSWIVCSSLSNGLLSLMKYICHNLNMYCVLILLLYFEHIFFTYMFFLYTYLFQHLSVFWSRCHYTSNKHVYNDC